MNVSVKLISYNFEWRFEPTISLTITSGPRYMREIGTYVTPKIGSHIHTGTQVTHLLFFDCKIGDFKIAGCVCL